MADGDLEVEGGGKMSSRAGHSREGSRDMVWGGFAFLPHLGLRERLGLLPQPWVRGHEVPIPGEFPDP